MLEYWLGRCRGFAVESPAGHARGTVQDVVVDESGRAHALVIRGRLLGRCRRIHPTDVEAVTPAAEVIAVRLERRRQTVRPALRLAGRATRDGLLAGGRVSAWFATQLRRHVPHVTRRTIVVARSAFAWLRPRAAVLGRLAAAALVSSLLVLVAVGRGLAAATRTYWILVARETARRRAS